MNKFTHIENGTLTELSYRKPDFESGEFSDLLDAVESGEKVVVSMSFKELKNALGDGSLLVDYTQADVEHLYNQL